MSFAAFAFAPLFLLRVLFWLINATPGNAWWALVAAALSAGLGACLRVAAYILDPDRRAA
jgi:hypothetical protein